MGILRLIEEEEALIKFVWGIQREDEEGDIKSGVERRFFQICAGCPGFPVRDCSEHGCFLLRQGDVDVLRGRYNPK